MRKLKIALLFAGQPRFITNPYPFASHKREILDKYDTETFCHLWHDSEAPEYTYNVWSRMDKCSVDPRAIEIVNDKYAPKVFVVEKPRDFTLCPKSRGIIDSHFPNNPVFDKRNVGNALSYLQSLENVANLFQKHCAETGERYDFVILSRLDSIIYRLPNLTTLNKEVFYLSNHHPRWPDLGYIMGTKYVPGLKCFSNVNSIIETGFHHSESFGEQIKALNMMNHCRKMWIEGDKTGSIQAIPLPIRLVRDLSGKGDEDALSQYGLSDQERFINL